MRIAIVGGGLSGLALADMLVGDITLFEKESCLGGLARSVKCGSSICDLGPHFFTSRKKEVLDYYLSFFPEKGAIVSGMKKARIYTESGFVSWPPLVGQLLRLSPRAVAKAALSMARSSLSRKEHSSAEDYLISRYGRPLYETMLNPLVSIFSKSRCSDLDASFARNILTVATKSDQGFMRVAGTVIRRKETEFIYPAKGSQEMIKRMERRLSVKTRVMKSCEVVSLDRNVLGFRCADRNECQEFDRIYWTAPITLLCSMLGIKTRLRFLNLVLYNIETKKKPKGYHYAYLTNGPFHRVSLLHNISPLLSRRGLITLEKTTFSHETEKIKSEEREQIEESLVSLGLSSPGDILEMSKVFVPCAYPLFYKGFQKDLRDAKNRVAEIAPDVVLFGRSGSYSYMNMDDVIKQALYH
jgi:protoporphyrinogen oxidase